MVHFGELQILELFALGDAYPYLVVPKPAPKIWLSHPFMMGVNCYNDEILPKTHSFMGSFMKTTFIEHRIQFSKLFLYHVYQRS